MNKALFDTDALSEIGKGVNLTVAATAYRRAFGHYTTSAVSVMEIVRGFQQNQKESAETTSLPFRVLSACHTPGAGRPVQPLLEETAPDG